MAKHLDYISPMIYPSHYADGNYGIAHPDMQPYETICAALMDSRKELYFAGKDGDHIAVVRPWLQDFTASWLTKHIPYGGPEVRSQIQAVYDCGYDEWLLWDAACTYDWDGLLTPEEAEAEREQIAQSRGGFAGNNLCRGNNSGRDGNRGRNTGIVLRGTGNRSCRIGWIRGKPVLRSGGYQCGSLIPFFLYLCYNFVVTDQKKQRVRNSDGKTGTSWGILSTF